MKSLTRLQADIVLLIVAILWGTTFVTSKLALQSLTPIAIITFRFILAMIFMMAIFRKEVKTINKNDILSGGIVGILLFVAFFIQLFGLKFTDPGKQAFLAGTYVVFVPFILWWLTKVKPQTKSFVGVFISFIGIALLSITSKFSLSFGDSITLLSSVFFAGHIVATHHFLKKSTPVNLTIVQFTTVAVLSSLIAVFTKSFPMSMNLEVGLQILYLGIVCTGLAYFLQTYAQKFAKSTHTAIILSLESVFGSLLSVIIYHEVFTFKMIIGSVLILTAIIVTEYTVPKKDIKGEKYHEKENYNRFNCRY